MSLKAKYEDKVYGITTTLDFGKYKGYTVGNILELDPDYLIWAMGAVKEFKLTYSNRKLLMDYSRKKTLFDSGFDDTEPYAFDYLWKE